MNPAQIPQSPTGPPQMPTQGGGMQAVMGSGGSAQPSNPQQAANPSSQNKKKGASMPTAPFTPAVHHFYNSLRNFLMQNVGKIPGIEDVLTAVNNAHVAGLQQQAQQPPQMPQQSQIPPQVLAQLMQGQGGGQGAPSAQMQQPPQMPQQGGQ